MEVRCARCQTEYEFDDALISERGTTVKCTQCGNQFRVFPAQGNAQPELWRVLTARGEELSFTSLRELQRAISERHVAPSDLLERGSAPPRPLGAIAELESFFVRQKLQPSQSAGADDDALASGNTEAARYRDRSRRQTQPLGSLPASERDATTQPPAAASSLPPSLAGRGRESFPDYDEPIESHFKGAAPKRAQARWIAGLVALALIALLGATVGRKYLARYSDRVPASALRSDPRVGPLLEQGQKLLEQGDVEGAKEAFDKASALAEKDATVRSALGRLEALRADVCWIRVRVLSGADGERLRAAEQELELRVHRASELLGKRGDVQEPALLRAHIDLLRIRGDLKRARQLVRPIAESAHLPENAYVLAALDMADAEPVWPSILERLRAAAASEIGVRRASAALVYALVRTGALDEAELELDKLRRRTRGDGLLPDLAALVQRTRTARPGGASGQADAGVADGGASKEVTEPRGAAELLTPQAQLARAAIMVERGEYTGAETAYDRVLAARPTDTEALAGLAEIAARRGDSARAARLYDQLLQSNPSYVPALTARADQKWSAGDRSGAQELYRRVLEHVGVDTSYGRHAQGRIASSESTAAADRTLRGESPQENP